MAGAFAIAAASASVAIYLWVREFRMPRRVSWRQTTIGGVSATVADDLVLQHDDGHTVWATRGYAIYRSRDGEAFERMFRIRPPLGRAWGGYLASLRSRYGYQELVELLPLGPGRFVVFAGGVIHLVDLGAKVIERTHRLRYFGPNEGRGVMAFGLTTDATGSIYFGEYTTKPPGIHPICIWKSSDSGRTWSKAFEFPPGAVRHIHAVQFDPYERAIWVATGDRNADCYVGVSHDGAASFEWMAQGTQACRACGFIFFPDAVFWGTDSPRGSNYLISLQREEGKIKSFASLPQVTYYHRKLDERRALLGLAEKGAEVWVANAEGDACPWLSWSVSSEAQRGPSPGIRLARGDSDNRVDGFVHVNPMRTLECESAIFRIAKSAVPHPSSVERVTAAALT